MTQKMQPSAAAEERDLVQEVAAQSGCSKADAEKMVLETLSEGLSVEDCLDGSLYKLSQDKVGRYLRNHDERSCIDSVASNSGVSIYDAFEDMERARTRFGISFFDFAERALYGYSDSRLEAASRKINAGTTTI